jgi:prepilin signal peptidase PulO-like enzyme (type II secretory pathway)
MRLWLSPHALSWPVLPLSILQIGLFAALSACIYATLDLLKEYHDRIPFAPLLFTGCVLSYTPFLTGLMNMVTQCNVLLSP